VIRSILRLVRITNLAIIIITFLVVRYLIIEPVYTHFHKILYLEIVPFWMMIAATVLIAAGGYILNDFYDIEIDKINHPQRMIIGNIFSPATAYITSVILLITGMGIGITMTFMIGKIWSASIYLTAGLFTWWYAVKLKRVFIWGNLTVAFLTSLTAGLTWIFEILATPDGTLKNNSIYTGPFPTISIVVLTFVLFSGLLNYEREIIKDIEDEDGDKANGCRTLPIVFGIKRTLHITGIISIIILILLLSCQVLLFMNHHLLTGCYLFAEDGILLYFMFRMPDSFQPGDFHKLSTLLKIIMVAGMFALLLWRFEYC
jgi:4-hydroxybenzoate polyprenyltransferase